MASTKCPHRVREHRFFSFISIFCAAWVCIIISLFIIFFKMLVSSRSKDIIKLRPPKILYLTLANGCTMTKLGAAKQKWAWRTKFLVYRVGEGKYVARDFSSSFFCSCWILQQWNFSYLANTLLKRIFALIRLEKISPVYSSSCSFFGQHGWPVITIFS